MDYTVKRMWRIKEPPMWYQNIVIIIKIVLPTLVCSWVNQAEKMWCKDDNFRFRLYRFVRSLSFHAYSEQCTTTYMAWGRVHGILPLLLHWLSSATLNNGLIYHSDVINWKHLPRNWPLLRGIHRSPVSKQSWGWWFEMLSHPLWGHCNAFSTLSTTGAVNTAPLNQHWNLYYPYVNMALQLTQ